MCWQNVSISCAHQVWQAHFRLFSDILWTKPLVINHSMTPRVVYKEVSGSKSLGYQFRQRKKQDCSTARDIVSVQPNLLLILSFTCTRRQNKRPFEYLLVRIWSPPIASPRTHLHSQQQITNCCALSLLCASFWKPGPKKKKNKKKKSHIPSLKLLRELNSNIWASLT